MEKEEEETLEKGLNLKHSTGHRGCLPSRVADINSSSVMDENTYLSYGLVDVDKNDSQSLPHPLHRQNTGVDVEQGEASFAELSRELTGLSQHSRRLSRTHSRRSVKNVAVQDLEKAATSESSDDEQFDLESYLRGNKRLEEEAGIKNKHIGVIWNDLTVSGTGGQKHFQPTFPDAFVDFFNVPGTLMRLFGLGKKGHDIDILSKFRGVAKPGEMVLVLGRPGSGCTTFLKLIANQRFGYTKIDGTVTYGPFDHKTFADRYRGEAVYNEEGKSICSNSSYGTSTFRACTTYYLCNRSLLTVFCSFEYSQSRQFIPQLLDSHSTLIRLVFNAHSVLT